MEVVQQGADTVLVVFPLPDPTIRAVTLLRRCGPPDENALEALETVEVSSLQPLSDGKRFAIQDPSPASDAPCTYGVRFRDLHGRGSPTSNTVSTQPGFVPAAPTNVRAEVRQSEIDVTWDPPADAGSIVGYYVDFRDLVRQPRYVLRNFEFGKPLSVVVQSVARAGDPMILSVPTAVLNLVPKDTFPPPVPTGLDAVAVGGGVQLVWDPVQAPDLEGYNVYVSRRKNGAFDKVAGPLPVPRYFHALERNERVLYYVVTAVDRRGNESPYSAEATATSQP